jgi:hypothetical protein
VLVVVILRVHSAVYPLATTHAPAAASFGNIETSVAEMNRIQNEANLDELCRRLEDYAVANLGGFSAARSVKAALLSESLFLAHSTADAKFSAVCASRYLTPRLNSGFDGFLGFVVRALYGGGSGG